MMLFPPSDSGGFDGLNTSNTVASGPVFEERISHSWSSRKLMGLKESYSRSQHDASIVAAFRELLKIDGSRWALMIEQPKIELHLRLAAGQALALLGDSRISTLDPAMVEINPPETVTLGLEWEQVVPTQRRNAKIGVEVEWIEKECPTYSTRLRPFRIAKYLVTNLEFSNFLEDTGCTDLPTSWAFGRYPLERSNHPVYTVLPETADAYAIWLSQTTGRRFRLPTEAEWEFAAGGPTRLEFPWGEHFVDGFANTMELGLLDSTPVGCFPLGNSIYGVTDMAGNVEEYVGDSYSPYPGGKFIVDDLSRIKNDYRIARGGSFARFRDLARTKRRHGENFASPVYAMGFRVVEEI